MSPGKDTAGSRKDAQRAFRAGYNHARTAEVPVPVSSGSETAFFDAPHLVQLVSLQGVDLNTRARYFTRLQQQHGNRTIQRVLVHPPLARQKTGAYTPQSIIQCSPGTQTEQEAEAAETIRLINTTIRAMQNHDNRMVRDTAGLFTTQGGQPARLTSDPMTPRSDSNARCTALGYDPNVYTVFFYGPAQNNEHPHTKNAVGTIDGSKVLIRRKNNAGDVRDSESLMATFAHEASHILVASYGEHPQTTTSAASFDRYKDEFRAYWIEPVGEWADMADNDDKARAIRRHLVGTSATSSAGYPDLRARYWNQPTEAAFKNDVDNHLRPDGYNLGNNPRLDRLFQLLQGNRSGRIPLENTLTHIATTMSQSDRAEARASPLIRNIYQSFILDEDRERVHDTLYFPYTSAEARRIDPTSSPRIASLLRAIISREDETIKEGFRQLNSGEKSQVRANAAILLFVDDQQPAAIQRASAYAMLTTGQLDQYDAMAAFLRACQEASIDALLEPLTEIPSELRSTLRALVYGSRLALYRLVENVRRDYVDVLPAPVNPRLLTALREGGEL